MNDVRWMRHGRRGGAVPDYKYGHNKPESEFLTVQAEHSQSCECLESCLAIECSMMESSTLFHDLNADLSPLMSTSRPLDVIHMIDVSRPSPFFALFCFVY